MLDAAECITKTDDQRETLRTVREVTKEEEMK